MKKFAVWYGISNEIYHEEHCDTIEQAIRIMRKRRKEGYIVKIWDEYPSGDVNMVFDGDAYIAKYFIQEEYGDCYFDLPVRFN